ncbi:CobW family GTP-binding protein [Shewanella sedimentimangrovi]|uniref:GTP-binding protein n=1 Tax=Shewanella sedimentimangrovi TaxID=2814293 RepID=A0ABX7R4V8_9GAMM|nr:GTP-binding protein [Shewanella sedimentimangrovi]QSX38215.1 GTP-binding protein [Shewanella sedimentimangrovi]
MIRNPVPVNLITGFLGSGKTTLIGRLLAHKPEGETWAVLLNEFGEVGLDAALLGKHAEVVIREVPGGCLCCAAGVPTQVAVNQLLARARPDRLLIEPTGLGHPAQILKLLQNPYLAPVLSIQTTVCLVDPRVLNDPRYTGNPLFNDQLAVADLILASKADAWGPDALAALQHYLTERGLQQEILSIGDKPLTHAPWLTRSRLEPRTKTPNDSLLRQPPTPLAPGSVFDSREAEPDPQPAQDAILRREHSEGPMYSCGWIFGAGWQFDFDALLNWVNSVPSLRLKAVMITADGILAINRLGDELKLAELDDALDSRLEIISEQPLDWAQLEQGLKACFSAS